MESKNSRFFWAIFLAKCRVSFVYALWTPWIPILLDTWPWQIQDFPDDDTNPWGGMPTYSLTNFPHKLHENEEMLAQKEGTRASCPYIDHCLGLCTLESFVAFYSWPPGQPKPIICTLKVDWFLLLTPFQILNSNQTQSGKLGLLIIKLPKAYLHHIPKSLRLLSQPLSWLWSGQQYIRFGSGLIMCMNKLTHIFSENWKE